MVRYLYVIAHNGYMGIEPRIYELRGTAREMIEHLNQVDDTNRNDEFGDENKTVADFSSEELLELFKEVNGDGQPFYRVWNVTLHRQVV